MESEIIKLSDCYKLSLKGVEPHGDLVKKICNVNLKKEDLISLYKTIDNYIQDNKELIDTIYNSKSE